MCVKCTICKHLAESREEMILHLKSSHEEEIDGVNDKNINCNEESKNEELSPENDITGLSFVLSDPEQINSEQENSSNFRTVIVQPQSQNNPGAIPNNLNFEVAKGGFLCGGCSRLFASEQEIAEHLSLSETCSV